MPSDASATASSVSPTLANTWRVAFAIWWKFCLIQLVIGGLAGFLGYAIPYGQLRFWLMTVISNTLSPAVNDYLFARQEAVQLAIDLAVALIGAIFLLLIMNVLVARTVGRRFGAFRLVLQRVQ
jgi:uncharacterized membrane protein YeaQ/YmgE (transglycosylase-associated protein family)